MSEMIERLAGTRIVTNVETVGKRERGFFGLVETFLIYINKIM